MSRPSIARDDRRGHAVPSRCDRDRSRQDERPASSVATAKRTSHLDTARTRSAQPNSAEGTGRFADDGFIGSDGGHADSVRWFMRIRRCAANGCISCRHERNARLHPPAPRLRIRGCAARVVTIGDLHEPQGGARRAVRAGRSRFAGRAQSAAASECIDADQHLPPFRRYPLRARRAPSARRLLAGTRGARLADRAECRRARRRVLSRGKLAVGQAQRLSVRRRGAGVARFCRRGARLPHLSGHHLSRFHRRRGACS